MPDERSISVGSDLDIVAARVAGRTMAQELGFDIIDQARIATAISELARNIVLHAESGSITLSQIGGKDRIGIQIRCEDRGQGIQDVDLVLQNGQTSAREEGIGLAGTQRLMDEFEIESQLGVGTTITARKWLS